jgi:hypothetical protein
VNPSNSTTSGYALDKTRTRPAYHGHEGPVVDYPFNRLALTMRRRAVLKAMLPEL